MELKVKFNCPNTDMKADFDAVESLAEHERSALQKEIGSLKDTVDSLKDDIDTLEEKADSLENSIKVLEEEKVAEYNRGVEKGKTLQYNDFWDMYQQRGTRTDYARAFSGIGWTEKTFKPKYSLRDINSAIRMFEGTGIKNLSELMIGLGMHLNLEGTTRTDYMFANCGITHVPDLDLRAVTNMEYMFYRAEELEVIEGLRLADDGSQELGARFFYRCYCLNTVIFHGQIGCDVDIRHSPLYRGSIENLISALLPTAEGKTVYLSKSRVNKEFETSKDAKDGSTSAAWLSLVASKPGWTISLV